MEEATHYENVRKRNVEEKEKMLAKLMDGVDRKLKIAAPVPKVKRNYTKSSRRIIPPAVIRRNPVRSKRYTPARFDLPYERPRSGSISSTISSASSLSSTPSSTPEKMIVRFSFFNRQSSASSSTFGERDEEPSDIDEEDDVPLPKVTRRPYSKAHEVKPVEDITQADLDMVAVVVSDKKYDSFHGSTCHQCRQKTDDVKTVCRSQECRGVRGQFCGPCLKNRYGEDAKVALLDPDWLCPPCRGICNCSFCRRKSGKASTGILVHMARDQGYTDVNSFLQGLKHKSQ